jgi:predicted pyridoxine 5'-phosphate oxidase superfamily flavin-nucleotide-binding protein
MLVVGSLDARRRPWASLLVGPPGFIRSPDPRTLRVHARPLSGDPLAAQLRVGAALGLLGIELETRRRNRVNGIVVDAADDVFSVRAQQSFGNCPKYIQARTPHWIADPETYAVSTPMRRTGCSLDASARTLIERADTFFIATATPDATEPGRGAAHGVDVSHRGGRPGFVRVGDDSECTVLTVPDFVGNYMFNTVGNLVLNPLAGLLFVDFEGGDLLSLTATAEIVWDGPEVHTIPAAERLLRFRIDEGRSVRAALPLRWSPPEFSPHL